MTDFLNLPQGKYKTIVIDPPWKYGKWGKCSACANAGKGFDTNNPLPYTGLSVDKISKLPVKQMADHNCEIYLWTTQRYLPYAFKLFNDWGVKYCQTLIWAKTPRGKGQGGLYTPTNEFIILGRFGKMPTGKDRVDTTWWNIKRQQKHSKKPEFFQDIIERQSDEPRLELFARRQRPGWTCWGDEL